MKTIFKFKKELFSIAFLMFCLFQTQAQVSACDQCVENNTNCDAQIIVTFYCNGSPCTNFAPTTIPAKTTVCFYSPCVGCSSCDMEIELVSFNLPPSCAVGSTNNKVSMSSPGPVYPSVPSPCDQCFDGGSQTPELKYVAGLFMIGY